MISHNQTESEKIQLLLLQMNSRKKHVDTVDIMWFKLMRIFLKKVKKPAVGLIEKIKAKISEINHWTAKQEIMDEVDILIGKILWEELPECYPDATIYVYRKKIYEYVFMRYKEVA